MFCFAQRGREKFVFSGGVIFKPIAPRYLARRITNAATKNVDQGAANHDLALCAIAHLGG